MKKIRLRFSNTRTLSSHLVAFFTDSWCSHVEFEVTPNVYIGSELAEGVFTYPTPELIDEYEVYEVEVTNEQYKQAMVVLLNQVGKKYDWWALVGNLFRRNWQETNKWFCSELVAYVFEQIGYPLVRDKLNRVTPADLLLSPLMTLVESNRTVR